MAATTTIVPETLQMLVEIRVFITGSDGGPQGGLLVLDEAQKITSWSEVVKRLWDEDTAAGLALRVVLLGPAPLLVQRGLTESLAGRFELIRVPIGRSPRCARDSGGIWTATSTTVAIPVPPRW